MDYSRARGQIRNGDLIAVKGRHGALAQGTRLVTGSDYTHTGTALWVGGRLLVAQMTGGGCCLVPLSQFSQADFDVYSCPVDREMVKLLALNTLGAKIRYDFIDLVRIALFIQLGVPLPDRDDGVFICSSLSAFIYLQAGWKPSIPPPSIPWPGALADALGGVPSIQVTAP